MDKITKKVKLAITWGGWVIAVVVFLWSAFGVYYKFSENMKVIQKSTLRNTIWNENIPMHDRLERL